MSAQSVLLEPQPQPEPITQHAESVLQRRDSAGNLSPDDIDLNFPALLRSFKILKQSKINFADIDEHFRQDKDIQEILRHVDKQGEENTSFIHFLVKTPKFFQERLPLIDWMMKKYPKLYLQGIGKENSILHVLSTKCSAIKQTEPLRNFISRYPSQVADILKKTEDQGKLLSIIIPFIRTLDVPEFLLFFGHDPEIQRSDSHACPTSNAEDAPSDINNIETRQNEPSQADSTFSKQTIGDMIVLRWAKEVGTSSQTSSKNKKQVPADPGTYKNDKGQTSLHQASSYCKCDEKQQKAQFNLVKRLFSWCPAALEETDAEGNSPYLHRIIELRKDGRDHYKDEIAFFLKDKIMHFADRDDVLALLYGRPGTQQPLHGANSRMSREPEMQLDLRELQNSGLKENLLTFIDNLEFEDILQYVRIPQHPFSTSTSSGDETRPGNGGSGRKDFDSIFDTLKAKNVRKILKLVVDDDINCLHQDEVIERLSRFEIEDFQWMKMDLSSMVLRNSVPKAHTLRLFSSGNHSVLRDWSSVDGLAQMAMLKDVYVKIYWKTESQEKTLSYANDFIKRMIKNCEQIGSIEISLEPLKSKPHVEWTSPKFLATTNKWIQTMQNFSELVGNISSFAPSKKPEIRVAVLDDGIDWSFYHEIQSFGAGRSFYADKRPEFNGQNPWFSSSTGHGTLMAWLIHKICPNVTFYIARLDQTESEHGVFQPTPESAAKAIQWATQSRVHIISMSWSIPTHWQPLNNAVTEARQAGILLFGAASDQGANSTELPYMAKLSNGGVGPVICIGGAQEAGYGDDRALPEAEFFFPGQIGGLANSLPLLKLNFSASTGSSVATALAVGLTALIMLLVNMSPKYGEDAPAKSSSPASSNYRQQLQDPNNIRKIFNHLQVPRDTPEGKARIIPVRKHFRPNSLAKEINGIPARKRAETGINILESVTEKLLRALTENVADQDTLTAPGSDDEADD